MHIISYDKKKSELTLNGKLENFKAFRDLVVNKLENERKVYGHVRFSEEREPGTDEVTAYVSLWIKRIEANLLFSSSFTRELVKLPVVHLLQKETSLLNFSNNCQFFSLIETIKTYKFKFANNENEENEISIVWSLVSSFFAENFIFMQVQI